MVMDFAVPTPPAFLDPLTEITQCYFYAVPKYFDLDHANTRWIICMIRNNQLDKVRRKMDVSPGIFRGTYFQLMDYPKLYQSQDPLAESLFHRKAVLYLTALGLTMYLKNSDMVRLLLEFRDTIGDSLYSFKEPQYATHIMDSITGDFHAFPLTIVMLRMGVYDYAQDLLRANWNPNEAICMPTRRRYERRVFYYLDWLDYALHLMQERPLLPLAKLVTCMTGDPTLYRFKRQLLTEIVPKLEKDKVRSGIMTVEELPVSASMIGVKSLLDMAVNYQQYIQTKERLDKIKQCVKQMESEGFNSQIVMAQAMDYDGNEAAQEEAKFNANNNAAPSPQSSATPSKSKYGTPYASEPTRIILFIAQCDAKLANKLPIFALLDAIAVYIKRHVYLIKPPTNSKKEKMVDKLAAVQAYKTQKRDSKNAVVLLLNLIQQQYEKMDKVTKQMKVKKEEKFKHLDTAKQFNNKLIYISRVLRRMTNLVYQVLLESGSLLDFVESTYPVYKYLPDGAGDVDFKINPSIEHRLRSIQLEVMCDFSASKTSFTYFTMEDMQRAKNIKEIVLNMRLGLPPTEDQQREMRAAKLNAKTSSNANSELGALLHEGDLINQLNTSSDACCQMLSSSGGCGIGVDWNLRKPAGRATVNTSTGTRGHVKFVKVQRMLPVLPMGVNNRQGQQSQQSTETPDEKVETVDQSDIAARLSEQIQQLRQSQDPANKALSEIYQRILDDLLARMADSEQQQQQEENEEDAELAEHEYSEAPVQIKAEKECKSGSVTSKRRSAGRHRNCCDTTGGGKKPLRSHRARRSARRQQPHSAVSSRGTESSGGHYQKARIYEAPVFGTEFDLVSQERPPV